MDLGPRYRFLRELGRGGAGVVFLARDTYHERDVALKLLKGRRSSSDGVQELQREYALLAKLVHPSLAKVYDFGYLKSRPYLTEEYIAGESLEARRQSLSLKDLLVIAREVCGALAYLHSSSVLHLDVKPSNIILRREPTPSRAVLIDLGLWRTASGGPPTSSPKGSLPFMAPERFRGGPLGPWTDVYAFGATLYSALTGAYPRLPSNAGDFSAASFDPAPRAPSAWSSGIPSDLDYIILRSLALDPAARYSSATELLQALEVLDGTRSRAAQASTAADVLLGREGEMASLERFLAAFRDGACKCPALTVTALPGMGQSCFLRHVKVRAEVAGFEVFLETGYPGRSVPPGALFNFLGVRLPPSKGGERERWSSFVARLRSPREPMLGGATENERRLRRVSELRLALKGILAPVLLVVDGLQFFDEVSVGLLSDLLHHLEDEERSQRPPMGIIAGYREEGPCVPILRELTELRRDDAHVRVITLGPLGLDDTGALFRRCAPGQDGPSRLEATPMSVYQRTGGCPRDVVALATRRAGSGILPAVEAPTPASMPPPVESLGKEKNLLLLTLQAFRRPSTAREIARACRISARRVITLLRELALEGHVEELGSLRGRSEWTAASSAGHFVESSKRETRRRIHAQVAAQLVARGMQSDGSAMVEAVGHFRAAGNKAGVALHGLRAARYLKSTFQNRAALEMFQAFLECVPRERRRLRLEATLDMAGLYARTGDLDQGIRLLQELLFDRRRLTEAARLRTLMTLAVLYSRRGDFERADHHLAEGLEAAVSRRKGGLSRAEVLLFLNEHAAVKAFTGHYNESLRLCQQGLELAARSRSRSAREVILNIHATRGSVALRTFDFSAAVRDFEKALEIAEAIGTPANQAIVLNNLGLALSQSDRYDQAIRAFREAERMCLRLDEGPSLVSIYGNLAVLYAKTGDFAGMQHSLLQAEEIGRAAIGPRHRFFLEHTRGLCHVLEGAYPKALAQLQSAIALGKEIGDRHVVGFDELYRAEALIFEARYAEAERDLLRLKSSNQPPRIRRMALARLAFLGAITAQTKVMEDACGEHASMDGSSTIASLDAWDRLFLAWAHSLRGDFDRAHALLESAEGFFRDRGLQAAHSLATWIGAEMRLLEGDSSKAREALRDISSEGGELLKALHPLLRARLELEESRQNPRSRERCADLLAKAGSAFVGNDLPEWSLRLAALRCVVGPEDSRAVGEILAKREKIAAGLPQRARALYRESRHWKVWTAGFQGLSKSHRRQPHPRPTPAMPGPPERTRTVRWSGAQHAEGLRASIVARSSSMRRLLAMLDRLRSSDAPVLVLGETGAGKELVARVLHEESERAAGPFTPVHCGSIPEALFEAELFGAKTGAFTDLKGDRPGLVKLAQGGTLFFDEVGAMPLGAQAKLLRVLSDKTFRPLGAEAEERSDVRFVFSTSRDLEEEAEAGRFRRDILHRVRVVTLRVPPLRERLEDLEDLIKLFLKEGASKPPSVEPLLIERLRDLPWHGNVRELRNLLLRLRVESPQRLSVSLLDKVISSPPKGAFFPSHLLVDESLTELKGRLERDYVLFHFRRLGGDSTRLSRFLKLSPRQLYRRCERLGISLREEKARLKEE